MARPLRQFPPSPPRAGWEWSAALDAYRTAEAALEVAGRRCSAASRAEIDAAEEDYGDRLEGLYAAMRRLLVVPAPGIGEFLVKVELAFEHEIGTLSATEACVAAIRADALRLRSAQLG